MGWSWAAGDAEPEERAAAASGDLRWSEQAVVRGWPRTAAVQQGILTDDQAAAGHSLAPEFLRWQTDRSMDVLGRADIVFVHNPEHAHVDREELHERLREAFAVLEEFADAGRIGGYGVAAWSAFTSGAFTVTELLGLAREAAGSGEHHLRAVQLPVSLVMARPSASPWTAAAP
ncbi:aldo/keto reductase [Streptomyces sp. NRRL S-448]|uniref:aldo/keto reductase n=1 Tax=Streptomyces sp. NRRL S-448 TaxID=1463907 RepID=UPI003562B968